MVRTINRQPYTVKQLDYGDIKYKFFNHSNWKGVCDDKNYLGVDQETFADSKNVYVDSEGLLKSRPSVKQYIMTQSGLQYIYDLWTFGQWTVYQVSNHYTEGLSGKEMCDLIFSNGEYSTISIPVLWPFKLIQSDGLIFVFSKDALSYYDTINKVWYNYTGEKAKNKIYTPVTSVVVKGVSTDNESPNVLTSSYITRYVYENRESVLNIKGKTGTVKIGDYTYTITFDSLTQLTLVTNIRVLTDKNYMDGQPLVFTNSLGYVLLGEWNDDTGYTLYYSNDELIYIQLPALGNQLDKAHTLLPAISQSTDHVYAVLYKDDGPYAYTIYSNSNAGVIPFMVWTNLAKNFSFNTNEVTKVGYATAPTGFTQRSVFNGEAGYYLDEKIYGFVMLGAKKEFITGTCIICDCISNGTAVNIKYTIVTAGTSILKTFCNSKYYIRYAFPLDKSAVGIITQMVVKLNTFAEIENLPLLIKYQYNSVTNPRIDTTVIKRSAQVQISAIEGSIFIDIILPTSYGASGVNTECNIRRIGFNYNESLYASTTLDYSSVSFEKYISLPQDMTFSIEHNSDYSITTAEGVTIYYPILSDIKYVFSSYINNIVTYKYFIYSEEAVALLFEGTPAGINKYFYIIKDNILYSSNIKSPLNIDVTTNGELTFDVFDHETELSQFFVSKGKNLYINTQGANVGVDDFKWYFPERNVQEFDYEITNLHPISTTEIAVFLQDSIYYVKPVTTTINGIETIAYSYYKSRIPLGCEEGSDVITSYDNKYTMFVTKRGFVAMSYQDFIASDEQALTFLSDTIYDMFNEWNRGAIKLFQYNFWIILYRTNTGKAFIFDMRSNSWWPIEYNSNVKKFIEIDRKPLLLSGLYLYKLDTSNDNYFDGNSLKDGRIDWFLSSQKLHLDAINYYKHIVNLTFFGYNYGDKDVNVRFNLRVINYRKQTDTNETKSFSAVDYKIQLTRTFVTRINYYKVNQVQYILESSRDEDAEDKIPVPLSLTAISLKYLVTGQVR